MVDMLVKAVELDTVLETVEETEKFIENASNNYSVEAWVEIVSGPGGWPVINAVGEEENILHWIKNEYFRDDEGMSFGEIEKMFIERDYEAIAE